MNAFFCFFCHFFLVFERVQRVLLGGDNHSSTECVCVCVCLICLQGTTNAVAPAATITGGRHQHESNICVCTKTAWRIEEIVSLAVVAVIENRDLGSLESLCRCCWASEGTTGGEQGPHVLIGQPALSVFFSSFWLRVTFSRFGWLCW